jgi:hypothetical protein
VKKVLASGLFSRILAPSQTDHYEKPGRKAGLFCCPEKTLMTVKAKFVVNSITDHGNDHKQVNLSAAVAGDGNKEWSKYTPSGSLTMLVTNPAASEQFIVGAEYLLTFEPA